MDPQENPVVCLILVVEDEVLLRMVGAQALVEAGFRVVEAEHGDEAMGVLSARADDIHALHRRAHARTDRRVGARA